MRRLAFSIYLPTFFSAIARGGALVLLPLYALESTNGAFIAAAIVGLRAAGTMIADVPAGLLTAKIGDKAVMLIGLSIVASMSMLAAFSSSAIVLSLVAVGFGLGGGAWILGRLSHITETVHLEKRGRVISVLAGLERAGAMIGPVAAGFAAEAFGYSIVFAVLSVFSLCALVLVTILTRTTEVRRVTHVAFNTFHIIGRNAKTYLNAGGVMICLSFLRHSRQLVIPVWGTAIGLGPAEIGLVFSLSSAVDLMMFYPAGLILDHIGRKAALIPAMTLMSIAIILLPWSDGFAMFLSVSLLAGLGNGFGTGIFMTLGSDFAPRVGRSQFLGVWRLIGDAGGVTGPFAIGAFAQAFSMVFACGLAGVVGLLGVIAAIKFIPESNPRNNRN